MRPASLQPTALIDSDVDKDGTPGVHEPKGRHDPCVLPRAVPIVEAMALLVLADAYLRHRGQVG